VDSAAADEPVYRGDNGVEGALANALGEVGPTITAAAVCEMLAFGVGAATDIPALKQFCIVACVAVAIDYFLQLTWFAAAIALDGRRQEASLLDVAPCCVRRRPAAAEAALRAAEAEGAGRGPRRRRGSSSSSSSAGAVAFGAPAPLSALSISSSSPVAATSPAAVFSPAAGVPGAFSSSAASPVAAGRTNDASGCGSLSALVYRGQYVRRFCRRYYTPALLWAPVRLLVLVLFVGMLGLSGYAATQMQLGLPQQLALPQGSYLTQVRLLRLSLAALGRLVGESRARKRMTLLYTSWRCWRAASTSPATSAPVPVPAVTVRSMCHTLPYRSCRPLSFSRPASPAPFSFSPPAVL
jgi:hypothetical protein